MDRQKKEPYTFLKADEKLRRCFRIPGQKGKFMEFDYSELRKKIENSKYKCIEYLAKAVCMTGNSLRMKFRGERRFSQEDMINICRVLDIPTEEIGRYFFKTKGELAA